MVDGGRGVPAGRVTVGRPRFLPPAVSIFLNSLQPHLHFTLKTDGLEQNFLDITVSLVPDKSLPFFNIFCKPTHIGSSIQAPPYTSLSKTHYLSVRSLRPHFNSPQTPKF